MLFDNINTSSIYFESLILKDILFHQCFKDQNRSNLFLKWLAFLVGYENCANIMVTVLIQMLKKFDGDEVEDSSSALNDCEEKPNYFRIFTCTECRGEFTSKHEAACHIKDKHNAEDESHEIDFMVFIKKLVSYNIFRK